LKVSSPGGGKLAKAICNGNHLLALFLKRLP